MKSRVSKYMVKGLMKNKTFVNGVDFFTILLLAICFILNQEFDFSYSDINDLIVKVYRFFEKEDMTTIGEELEYWANKHDIVYK